MRTKKGIVTGDKMQNTVVVTVNRYKLHPKYKKKYLISKKFYAHDPDNSCKVGDQVTIRETRPLSKLKRWIVVKDANVTKETTTEKTST